MSFGGFILGLIIMTISFFTVRYANKVEMSVGNLSDLLGFTEQRWLDWRVFGIVGIIFGFLIAFGLLQSFFSLTIGRLFLSF